MNVNLPKIALLGRPNVGKSTLFNVLAIGRENKAITHPVAGTTRDVRQTAAQLFGRPFMLLDTAGIEQNSKADTSQLQRQLNTLSLQAANQADVLLLLLDGVQGLTPADRALAGELRKLNKPTILVVNKADVRGSEQTAREAATFGFGEPVLLSAAHREGLGLLEDALDAWLPPAVIEAEEAEVADLDEEDLGILPEAFDAEAATAGLVPDDAADAPVELISRPIPSPLRLAVVGRPNVGKSTLVNALLREEAMLTGPTAGLTREAIRHGFTAMGHNFSLIDTPGLRKRGKIDDESLEHLSAGQSLGALQHAHVLLLVIDASVHNEVRGLWQVFEQQDATIAQAALRAHKPMVLVLSKWDLVTDKTACMKDVLAQLRAKLHGIHTPLVLPVSATRKQGLGAVLKAVMQVQEAYGKAYGTAKLNRTLAAILAKRSPPLANGRMVSLKFLRQICSTPPTFALWGNRIDQISGHYLQFLKHQLAENLGLTALPITLHLRANKNPYEAKRTLKAIKSHSRAGTVAGSKRSAPAKRAATPKKAQKNVGKAVAKPVRNQRNKPTTKK